MRLIILAGALMVVGSCKSSSSDSPSNNRPVLDFCAAGERPMLVTNKSSQTVWVGITSGSFFCRNSSDCASAGNNCIITGSDASGPTGVCGCTSESLDCGMLGVCSTNTPLSGTDGKNGFQCFWKLPRMVDAQTPQINPAENLKLCFPAPSGAQSKHRRQTNALSSVQWSGDLFARLGCNSNGQNCASGECSTNNAGCSSCTTPGDQCISNGGGFKCKITGAVCTQTTCGPGYIPPSGHTYAQDCPNNGSCTPQDGTCNAGTGGLPPATLAEFTFTAPAPNLDYYDISIINGINIGIAMEPDSKTTTKSQTDPYFCSTPGAQTQNDPLGVLRACSWQIKPNVSGVDQSTLLRQVKPAIPSKSCTSNDSCDTGQICGLAQNTGLGIVAKVCGTFVAYWSADQICGSNPGASNISPLICNTQNTNLFGCTGGAGNGSTSCYQDVTSCDCGCPTYQNSNPDWPRVLDSQGNCNATNQTWVDNIQPWLVFMKQACPTAYTFPFDDKTSTFTCHANESINSGEAPGYYIDFIDLK